MPFDLRKPKSPFSKLLEKMWQCNCVGIGAWQSVNSNDEDDDPNDDIYEDTEINVSSNYSEIKQDKSSDSNGKNSDRNCNNRPKFGVLSEGSNG